MREDIEGKAVGYGEADDNAEASGDAEKEIKTEGVDLLSSGMVTDGDFDPFTSDASVVELTDGACFAELPSLVSSISRDGEGVTLGVGVLEGVGVDDLDGVVLVVGDIVGEGEQDGDEESDGVGVKNRNKAPNLFSGGKNWEPVSLFSDLRKPLAISDTSPALALSRIFSAAFRAGEPLFPNR